MKRTLIAFIFLFALEIVLPNAIRSETSFQDFDSMIGEKDALLVMDEQFRPIYAKNADNKLIPASTLKILTSLLAFHYLGEDFHFKTEFYLDGNSNLIIKGYGDPFFVSEVIWKCCNDLERILSKNKKRLNDVIVDDSYFDPIYVPGVTAGTSEPYDAPSGALCSNFNTVSYTYNKKKRKIVSPDSHTPLVSIVYEKIKKRKEQQGRFILSDKETSLYTGQLFREILKNKGVKIRGSVKKGYKVRKKNQLIYTNISPYNLNYMIKMLLRYSNNFIANQIFLTIGARVMGPPATLGKGVIAAKEYSETQFCLKDYSISEGSGISRANRISANNMILLIKEFMNRRSLMRTKQDEFYKTGTLSDVSTRAGFFEVPEKGLFPFVIMLNTSHKSSEKIEQMIHAILCRNGKEQKADDSFFP